MAQARRSYEHESNQAAGGGRARVAALVALGAIAARAQGHMGHAQTAEMPSDLHYFDMTIMHHEQSVEMARLAQEKGTDPRVKAVAR